MEIILLFLTATIMSAVFLAAYKYGFREGYKKKAEELEKVEINENNLAYVKDLIAIANYTGKESHREVDLNE